MKTSPIVLSILLTLTLTGCATQPPPRPANADAAAFAAEVKRPDPPVQALTEQMLYETLLAEVALQRGDFTLATRAYLDLLRATNDYRIAERGAQIALNARRVEDAQFFAQRWLELEPESIAARQALAGVLVSRGQLDEARPHIEAILKAEGPNIGFAFLHMNNLLMRHPDRPAALALVRQLAAAYPQVPEAHFAVARAAWGAGDKALAVAETDAALAQRPGWEGAALFKAQVLLSQSVAQATAYYQSYLATNPRSREMRLAYARLLVQEKQFGPARDEFKRLVADFPNNAEVPLAIGLISLQLNEYETAEQYLLDALRLGVKDEDAVRFYLGQLSEERKHWDLAKQWYELVTGSQAFAAKLRIAGVLVKQDKLDAARAYLQQLPTVSNDQRAQAVQAEAQLLRDAKQFQTAYDVLGRGLEKLPNHPDLLYDRAMAAEKLDRLDVLEADLKKLIKVKPDNAHAYNALGYTLADRTTRFDEAKQYLEQALKLAPEDAFILDSMGWLMFRQRDFAQAIVYLRRALSLRADPEIAAHLGEVLWISGSKDEARNVWNAALKNNPGHETLTGTMQRLQAR